MKLRGEDSEMKKVDSWTATYEDFHSCSERFTEELDRFHEQIRDSQTMLVQTNQAYESELKSFQKSFVGITEKLSQSVEANKNAVELVVQIHKQSKINFFGVGLGFVLVSGLAIFGASYATATRESPLEVEIRQDAARFELIWGKATPREKAMLQKIWSRPPAAR
ncbi:hypothetical protein [Pseudomonas viridiflava]|uniref:hypothetical protein n=1 Tax=Pseudomonas viridiflava TaxID=33069 RepID=UPI000F054B94|nr:hypothetical protein [Pseudomonas viridiflava]